MKFEPGTDCRRPSSIRRFVTTTAITIAVLGSAGACDSSQQAPSGVESRLRPRGAYLQSGNVKRLNLPTPEAQASVTYKDPVQGVLGADGRCRFPNLGRMRVGLMATVGEWNTETCAGLLYYFRNNPNARPQAPSKAETTIVTSEKPERGE